MKKFILGFLFVAVAIVLAACKPITPDDPPGPGPGPGPSDEVQHLTNFVRDVDKNAQLRAYNEKFDTLIDDFSSVSAANVKNHLRVVVDNEVEAAPVSADASIYKMATGAYEIQNYDGIGFRVRKVGEGKLDLSNLVLALRGDDKFDVYELNLGEAVNTDGEALPELTGEYQDLVVCPNLSIEDDTTEYQLAGAAGASGVKVLEKILGFHLYAKGECAQVIEIESVFIVKGAEVTVLDAFNRDRVNKVDDFCWWRDSTGFIVKQGYDVSKGAYVVKLGETTEANLVLEVMGDSSDLTVGGKKWSELKDANGNALCPVVNGSFNSFVINLAASGLTARDLEVKSSKEVVLSKVFVTDLTDREAVTEYPLLDVENHVGMFDNFNRTQSGFDGDYDKSIINPIVTGAGLNYALSYKNGDKVTVADGVVTFDATNLAAGDYINFKEGNNCYDGQRYLVLVVKAVDGANYNDFRFNAGNGVVYVNQMVSAFGLPLPKPEDKDYVYTDANGFQWLVVDLAESGMVPNASDNFIDFYYSGTGKLLIDSAFYCDEVGKNVAYDEIVCIDNGENPDVAGYGYLGAINTEGDKYIKLTFTAAAGVTLESLRIGTPNGEVSFKAGQIYDNKGNVIDYTQEANGLTLIVDCEKSGLALNDWNHLHSGGWNAETGALSVRVVRLHEKPQYDERVCVSEGTNPDVAGYGYIGGFNLEGATFVKLTITAADGVTLESLRIGTPNGEVSFKAGQIYDVNGNVIDHTQAANGLTLIIDAVKSGLALDDWNHLHSGGWNAETGAISISISALKEKEYHVYEDKRITTITVDDMTNYAYGGEINPEGHATIKMVFTCETEDTLVSLRFGTADGDKWFKDGVVFDAEGKAIDGNTKLNGLTLVIDCAKTGMELNGVSHLHTGGFGDAKGPFSVVIYVTVDLAYANIMATLK